MVRGAIWMVLFKFIDRGLGLISTMILARLLVPEDFGLIAMAMSLVAILEVFGAFGFDMALITNPAAERRHYDTAWTFNVLFGLVCGLALLALALPAAGFFHETRLVPIVVVLAAASLVQGFENIGVVAFRKELRFDKEFRFLLGKRFAGLAVSIPLALVWQSYWALVAGILAGRITNVLLSYYVHPYRPRWSLAARGELLHFSKWLLLNNLLVFGRERSGDFAIGRLAGPRSLGLYSVGYELSYLPATELVAPINRAVFPAYAQMAAQLDLLKEHFLRVLGVIAVMVLPAGAGIALTAHLFVPLLLGPKWLDAVLIIQILALSGTLGALQTNFGAVYLAIGRPRITTEMMALNLLILIPLLIVLTRAQGPVGAAWSVLVTSLLMVGANVWRLVTTLDLHVTRLIAGLHRPLVAVLIMAATIVSLPGFDTGMPATGSHALLLLGAVVTGAITYIAALLGLWILENRPAGAERDLLDRILTRASAARPPTRQP